MSPSVGRLPPAFEHAAPSEAWLRRTLEEILSQIRVLLDVDGCAFQTIDHERSTITQAASWFERPELRTAMGPVLERLRPRARRRAAACRAPSRSRPPFWRLSTASGCSTPMPDTCRRCASADGSLIELPATGLPFGVEDDAAYEEQALRFGESELLFASTDGLIEARRGGELFGQGRVRELVAEQGAALSAQELVELAYARALRWAPQLGDDVAIIALRRR